MPQSGRLQGRNCLIVGGTSGIGLATARRFLVEGALVAVCGHSRQTAEEARLILDEAGGQRVLALSGDASDPAQVEGLFEAALAFFSGRLDILYHVAGISGRRFGDAGIGTRSAVGMGALPGGIAVEIEAIFQIKD